jgi:hypothetical protein
MPVLQIKQAARCFSFHLRTVKIALNEVAMVVNPDQI